MQRDHLHRYAPTPLEAKTLAFAGMAVSDGDVNQFRLFVGPKDVDLLKRIDPKLEQLVDFGWMSVLAKPLFLIVNWANDNDRAQLRLVHHPGHHRYQLRAVPAASCRA